MRWVLALIALLVASPALGQLSYPPANVEQLTQLLPPVCTTPPMPDAAIGTAGSGQPCVHRQDAAPATIVPQGVAITATDGSFSGLWPDGVLPYTPTRGFATIYSTVAPYHCQLGSLTASGYAGKCWQLVSTTLPNVPTALLSLVVSPIANPAAGLTVNVFARK